MLTKDVVTSQLGNTLDAIELPELGERISGKVRDSYVQGDKRILVTSDRLSAFDRVLTTIPFKGQILNDMAAYWFNETAHIAENHILDRPHPNVFVCQQVEILPVEVIIRGYLTGSAWRDYQAGKAISGIVLPEGLKKSQKFDTPLITPSTKAEMGAHDEPISSEEIVAQGLVEKSIWKEVCDKALALFEFGSKRALENGLIFVDTKYEFGLLKKDGETKVILADEIHTSDSSRFWIAETYEERFAAGEDPHMLDKEFVRRWLIEQGYMGEGTPPEFSDEFRVETALRYMEAFEKITGQKFSGEAGNIAAEIKSKVSELKQ